MTSSSLRLCLYQPDIPQNTGTLLRLTACLNVPVHIIGPAGFDMSDRAMKRAGLDYLEHVDLTRHLSFETFEKERALSAGRLILSTTKSDTPYTNFSFEPGDYLMMGRESAGVPDTLHNLADARITIPMKANLRSINVALAASMIIGEALRQLSAFPEGQITK